MTRLQRLWLRWICRRLDTCQVDWMHETQFGIRQCTHCERPMPEPRSIVGNLFADNGD